MRVAVFGRTHWLYDTIPLLRAKGHEIVLVATATASPEYRRTAEDFRMIADEIGAHFLHDAQLNRPEHLALLDELRPDIGVSMNWPSLVPDAVISRFPFGVLNAHPGDLRRFRGNAAPNWAIIAGEERVVLTVHLMADELDGGDILRQAMLPLAEDTTIGDVYRFLDDAIPSLFVEAVESFAAGDAKPVAQPDDPALWLRGYPRLPRDSELEWELPALDLVRLVRASSEPFAGAYSFLGSDRLTIWRAYAEAVGYPVLGAPGQVVDARRSSGEVAVLTGDGVLVIVEAELQGGRTSSGSRARAIHAASSGARRRRRARPLVESNRAARGATRPP